AEKRTKATAPFSAAAAAEMAMPSPTCSSGAGLARRRTAATAMAAAAARIIVPSTPLAKYSALEWPKACSSSGGRAATESAQSATRAATRLIEDAAASESRPIEPVTRYAVTLSAIVTIAAAIERAAYDRGERPAAVTFGIMEENLKRAAPYKVRRRSPKC